MHLKNLTALCLTPLALCGLAGAAACSKPKVQPPAQPTQPSQPAQPAAAFKVFKFVSGAGPCPPDRDCSGFIELSADGTLRVDNIGEMPRGTVHEIKVTPAELQAILPVLTAPALRGLLDTGGQDCPVIHDVWESMSLTMDGVTHEHKTTACSDQPIQDARKAILGLAKKYFPTYFSS